MIAYTISFSFENLLQKMNLFFDKKNLLEIGTQIGGFLPSTSFQHIAHCFHTIAKMKLLTIKFKTYGRNLTSNMRESLFCLSCTYITNTHGKKINIIRKLCSMHYSFSNFFYLVTKKNHYGQRRLTLPLFEVF